MYLSSHVKSIPRSKSVANIWPTSSTQPPSASLPTPRVCCAKATAPGSRVSRARLPRACTRTTTCSSAQRPLPSLRTQRRSLRRRSCRSSLMLSRSSLSATCAISLSPVRRLVGSILMMVLWDWPVRRVRCWVCGHSGRRLCKLGWLCRGVVQCWCKKRRIQGSRRKCGF